MAVFRVERNKGYDIRFDIADYYGGLHVFVVPMNMGIALLILPQYFDVIGVWISVPLAELLTIFVSLAFILKNKKVYHYL